MGQCQCLNGAKHERGNSISGMEPELGAGINNMENQPQIDSYTTNDLSDVYNNPSNMNNTKHINKYLKEQHKETLKVKKCLLLGAGSSGKSTLFRQLKVIHGDGFDPTEFIESAAVIRQNCVNCILILLKKSIELFEENKEQNSDLFIDVENEENVEIKNHVHNVVKWQSESFEDEHRINDDQLIELGISIQTIWQLKQIQATYNKRQYFSIIENTDYFLDKVDIIMDPHYNCTEEDHLKCRIRTAGLISADYVIQNVQFHIFDVGGQRTERKKWIQLFEGVTAVIFVAALNHYAAVLFEDENKNAMLESLQLFEEICNSKWFRATEMILFLNKNDLFRERIREGIPLSIFFNKEKYKPIKKEYYEEYDGPQYQPNPNDDVADQKSLDQAHTASAYFIQSQYEKRNHVAYKRIFVHITTATDRDNIQKVFWDVQNIVINSNLRKGGLV